MTEFKNLLLLLSLNCFATIGLAENNLSPEKRAAAETLMKDSQSGIGFLENKGQIVDDNYKPVSNVLFKSQLQGVDLYITTEGITYVFLKLEQEDEEGESPGETVVSLLDKAKKTKTKYARVDVDLQGAKILKENVITETPSAEDYRFYFGYLSHEITGVKRFQKIIIKEVYPGIDWIWYVSKNGQVKYDFVVQPHTDPGIIQMKYKWAKLKVNTTGESLTISTPVGKLTEGSAVSFSAKKNVETHYQLKDNTVSFILTGYDQNENLVIDPPLQLVWSSAFQGSNSGIAYGIACDNTGNVFISGYTQSTATFPTKNAGGTTYFKGTYNGGSYDCFFSKFDVNGVLLWSTYYGGTNIDIPAAILIDGGGNLMVSGLTYSTNFVTKNAGGSFYFKGTNSGGSDLVILKFSNNGTLLWSTYYGGSLDDFGGAITMDGAGNIFFSGYTSSTNFPLVNPGGGAYMQLAFAGGMYDCFILKFNTSGTILWATYYGGSAKDFAGGMKTDLAGNLYFTGYTDSPDFPQMNPGGGAYFQSAYGGGLYDVFLIKLASTGALIWSTYYGGGDDDKGSGLVLDPSGNIFVTGPTLSSNFPTLNPGSGTYFQGVYGGNRDGFILEFNNGGSPVWATYFGGTGLDQTNTMLPDPTGNLYMTGITQSANLPLQKYGGSAYYDSTWAPGHTDLFFLLFSNSGTMKWSTYFGGDGEDDVVGIALNSFNCDLYFTGDGGGALYSVTNTATYSFINPGGGAWFQSATINADCPMVGRFNGLGINCTVQLTAAASGTNISCNGTSNGSATVISSNGTAPYNYIWSPGGKTTQTITGLSPGTYMVIVTDATSATTSATVTVMQPPSLTFTLTATNVSCNSSINGTANVFTGGGTSPYSYLWNTGASISSLSSLPAGNYTVTVTDKNGCTLKGNKIISQPPLITLTLSAATTTCGQSNGSAQVLVSGGIPSYSYQWNSGSTFYKISNLSSQIWSVTVTDASGCNKTGSIQVGNNPGVNINLISNIPISCNGGSNGSVEIAAAGGSSPYFYQWNTGLTNSKVSSLQAAVYSVTVTDSNGCTSASAFTVSVPSVLTALVNSTINMCNGGNTGSASASPFGGTPGYFYQWSNGFTIATINNLFAGNYTVTVTDANGCSTKAVANVIQPSVITITITVTDAGCNQSNGSLSALAMGGNGGFSYTWSNSMIGSVVNNLGQGIYSCTVTDANNCKTTGSVLLNGTSSPPLTISADTTITKGTSTMLSATFYGSSPIAYHWSPSSSLICNTCQNPIANPTITTTYYVTVTDNNGCTASNSVIVSIEIICEDYFIPTAFSPNNDGENDNFCVYSNKNCFKSFQLFIYNRWGEKVFATNNSADCWDGNLKDKNLSSTVFIYYFNAVLLNNDHVIKKGNITLIQ